jgi:DNA replication and repair protein RecF
MTLRRMQVTDFRCLHQADVDFDRHFTLISGPNASGKTSLLEAIYVLGRGRSFRTRRLHHLIRTGCERFIVFGEVELPERRVAMGIEGSATGIRARLAGEKAGSLAELATVFPVQIIDPEVHRLIEEGPNRRRRFLDWGVFHVEPAFVSHWQQYHHVLKQRNAALRARQSRAVISAWDGELVRFGDLLTQARSRYVAQLATQAGVLAETLLAMQLALVYRTGWGRNTSLGEALEMSFAQDQESGVTSVGPHRADLAIRLDGFAVKDRISRGQQKLLAAALLIAQLKLFPEDSPVRPTLLLDDPAAELDGDRLAGLIHEVRAQSLQLVVSTLHAEFSAFGTPGRKLRLDGGVVIAAS